MAGRADPDPREALWIGRVVAHDDHDAFAELVRLHQSAIRQFLRRLTGNDTSLADDLSQDTFWKAYRHLGSFEGRGRFLSWLFRIAYQEFVTSRRGAGGVVPVPLERDVPAGGDAHQAFANRRAVDQMMATLRPDERAAVLLHYRHELTHPEIAQALGLPLGTIKSLIRRARQKLQETHATGAAVDR